MDARTRLGWIRLHEQVGNAGLVCRRCGIARPTLREWWRRYQAEGVAGLEARSHRPHRSPNREVFAEQEALILGLRRERELGIKMPRNEPARRHGLRLALDTIHEVLVRHGENRLKRPRLRRKGTRRYGRPVPGDRVQMDTCKIRPGLYPCTAIDDCSRWQVLGLYPRRTAADTLDFLDRVAAGMPFPVQRVQRPTAARSPSPTRSRTGSGTGSGTGGSSPGPTGPARRTSTARSSASSAPRWRGSGRRSTRRARPSPRGSRAGGPSTTTTARTALSAAGRRRSGSRSWRRRSPPARPSTPPTTRAGSSPAARTPATAGSQPTRVPPDQHRPYISPRLHPWWSKFHLASTPGGTCIRRQNTCMFWKEAY
jgi:transposase-like protein